MTVLKIEGLKTEERTGGRASWGSCYPTSERPFLLRAPSPVLVRRSLGMVNNRHTPSLSHCPRAKVGGAPNPPLRSPTNEEAPCFRDFKVKQTDPSPSVPLSARLKEIPEGVTTFGLSSHTSKFAPHTNSAHGFVSSRPRADIRPLCCPFNPMFSQIIKPFFAAYELVTK